MSSGSEWRQQCALDGECGFAECEPPKMYWYYYGNTTIVTWSKNSREEEVRSRLGEVNAKRYLLGEGTGETVGDPILLAMLIKESFSLETEFKDLLRARIEDTGET